MPSTLHELRVLAGPQSGSRLMLAPGATVDVGSIAAGNCHVVLRDPDVQLQRVRLRLLSKGLQVELLAGSMELAGQPMVVPCSPRACPWFTPLQVGRTVLAVGCVRATEAQWDRAAVKAESMPSVSLQPDERAGETPLIVSVDEGAMAVGKRRWSASLSGVAGRIGRIPGWFQGGASAVALVGALWALSLLWPSASHVAQLSTPQRAVTVLRSPEFKRVKLLADQVNGLRIQGDLLSLADRARLEHQLSLASVSVPVDVRIGEQVAEAVCEVFRMNGVRAQVQPPAGMDHIGDVEVITQESDLKKLQQAEAAARRDVKGLMRLAVHNEPQPRPRVSSPVRDDPGKRLASVVRGSTSYVVTVDGTRYFSGALLPSGHRLAWITPHQVMLEKEGEMSTLIF